MIPSLNVEGKNCVWRPFLIVGVLALAAGEVRAADILELLKTHKIVIGEGCKEPCTLPAMNPRSEIRLASGLLMSVDYADQTGFVYPIGKELDILGHPLMAGYFKRHTGTKYSGLKTKAEAAGDVLTLTARTESVAPDMRPPDTMIIDHVTRIAVSGTSCSATWHTSARFRRAGFPGQYRWLLPCQIEPLTSSAVASKRKQRTLTFANLRSSVGRSSQRFLLVGDRLYAHRTSCDGSDVLAIVFSWRGGPLKSTADCSLNSRANKLSYASETTVEGTSYRLRATAREKAQKFSTDYNIDIRFRLDGNMCRIDSYVWDSLSRPYPTKLQFRADAQSSCFFD